MGYLQFRKFPCYGGTPGLKAVKLQSCRKQIMNSEKLYYENWLIDSSWGLREKSWWRMILVLCPLDGYLLAIHRPCLWCIWLSAVLPSVKKEYPHPNRRFILWLRNGQLAYVLDEHLIMQYVLNAVGWKAKLLIAKRLCFALSSLWYLFKSNSKFFGSIWMGTLATPKKTAPHSQDFCQHAKLCDELLGHYHLQWKNREQYWLARSRSQTQRDLLTGIIDSYDKSKLQLPQWPFKRCPKRAVYEATKRNFLI